MSCAALGWRAGSGVRWRAHRAGLVSRPRLQEGGHAQEIAQFQAELSEARAQLQLLQQQLDEQLSKQPVGNQEVTLGTALPPALRTGRRGSVPGTLSPVVPCPLARGRGFVLSVTS